MSPLEKLQRLYFIFTIDSFFLKLIFLKILTPFVQQISIFWVTESMTNRSITNFPSSALRILLHTLKYPLNLTKTLL